MCEVLNVNTNSLIDFRRQKGWLKICSKSLVFDPKDVHFPILKVGLNHKSSYYPIF